MSVTAGSTILANDVIASSAGAADAAKIPKLDANGRLDTSFFKAPTTYFYSLSGVFTWTKPSGCVRVRVRLVGAGGGSGGVNGGVSTGAGSGAYSEKLVDVSGTTAVIVRVGAGGLAGANPSGAGGIGGTSSFADATAPTYYLAATGGTGSNSLTEGVGGTATGGNINVDGGNGVATSLNTAKSTGAASFFGSYPAFGAGGPGVQAGGGAAGLVGAIGAVIVEEQYY